MDVLDASSPIINGPFGTINDNSLDGGNSSTHGYVLASSLPSNVQQIMDNNDNPSYVAVAAYAYGSGSVTYSTIPAEYYTDSFYGDQAYPFALNLTEIYLPNELRGHFEPRNLRDPFRGHDQSSRE